MINDVQEVAYINHRQLQQQLHDPTLKLLKNDVNIFVNEIQRILEEFTGFTLQQQLSFKHNDNAVDEGEEVSTWTRQQWSDCEEVCPVDCTSAVLGEAQVGSKNYTAFLRSVLLHQHLNVPMTVQFGFFPALRTITRDLEISAAPRKNASSMIYQTAVEMGGGSGFGFQLYCDDDVILTAGGGGGGGIYYQAADPENDQAMRVTIGGGGGMGVQMSKSFALHQQVSADSADRSSHFNNTSSSFEGNRTFNEFHSVGGGGGCGTCNAEEDDDSYCPFIVDANHITNSGAVPVVCGFTSDDDAASDTMLHLLRQTQYSPQLIREECGTITVRGGGGGGGGTDLCCLPLNIGYGFAFKLSSNSSSSNSDDEFIGNNGRIDNSSYTASSFYSSSTGEIDSDQQNDAVANINRFKYDFVGKLLYVESLPCGGYEQWCCLCAAAQNRIRHCLDSISTIWPHNVTGNETVQVTCSEVVENRMRVDWFLETNCCTDNTNTSDDPSSGNDSNSTTIVFDDEKRSSTNNMVQTEAQPVLSLTSRLGRIVEANGKYDNSSRLMLQLYNNFEENGNRTDYIDELRRTLAMEACARGDNVVYDAIRNDAVDANAGMENESVILLSQLLNTCSASSYSNDMRCLISYPSLIGEQYQQNNRTKNDTEQVPSLQIARNSVALETSLLQTSFLFATGSLLLLMLAASWCLQILKK